MKSEAHNYAFHTKNFFLKKEALHHNAYQNHSFFIFHFLSVHEATV